MIRKALALLKHQKHDELVRKTAEAMVLCLTEFDAKRGVVLPKAEEDEVFRWTELICTS